MKSLDIFCEENDGWTLQLFFFCLLWPQKKSTKMIMGFCVFAHEKVSDNFGSISTIVLLVGQKHATLKTLASLLPCCI